MAYMGGYVDDIFNTIQNVETTVNRGINDVRAAGGADEIQQTGIQQYVPSGNNAMLIIGGLVLLFLLSKSR